jgi:hypothetical protein
MSQAADADLPPSLQGPESPRLLALKASFCSSVHLAWSTTSADSLLCLVQELEELAAGLRQARGQGFFTLNVGHGACHAARIRAGYCID